MVGQDYEFDVFISHAIEDKIAVANELYEELCSAGLKVLYSGCEFRYGDDPQRSLSKGLLRARNGIIILSKSYLSKTQSISDLKYFLQKPDCRNSILLILNGVGEEEILSLGFRNEYLKFDQSKHTLIDQLIDRFRIKQLHG